MQPCGREMQAMNSMMNQSQMSLPDLQNGQHHHHHQIAPPQIHHFDTASSHDDFLDQMLSSLPSSSWPDLADANPNSPWDLSSKPEAAEAAIGPNMFPEVVGSDDQGPSNPENVSLHQFHFEHDQSAVLASKLRRYQISSEANSAAAVKALLLQQQLLFQSTAIGGGGLRSPTGDSCAEESGMFRGSGDDVVDASSFKSPNSGIDGSVQALYNGFAGSLHGDDQTPNQGQHFHHPQAHNFEAAATGAMNQAPAGSWSAGLTAQPKQPRVRARRGQATDPHSIAERLRRERIAERMKALQELVPNANKTDKASMLDEIIDYVKFLQLQVKVLSMSRLGGAAAVAPLVADMSSEGGGDCIHANVGGPRGGSGTAAAASASTSNNDDSLTVTEHQVAKLMEEDMGTAMQYLQGKGLCLMPISLATAISTATSHSRNVPIAANPNPLLAPNGAEGGSGGGPSSPSLSVLTVQSGAVGNDGADISGKDAVFASKP